MLSMSSMSSTRTLWFALSLVLLPACAEPSSSPDESSETSDETSDDASDDAADEPELGDTPLPSCEAAMFSFEQLAAELALPEPDLDYVIELYRGDSPDLSGESPIPGGTALQRWVREVGARLGRVEAGVLIDDAAIEAALDLAATETGEARTLALVDVLGVLRSVALLDVRARLAEVADVLPDPQRDPSLLHAQWDQAWCVWDGVLGPLASEVEASEVEAWETTILAAFESGYAGIMGPEQAWAADEFATKPAKQIIEKGSFGVVERVLIERAERAHDQADPLAAREALGLFALLEDRVRDRNTPAIELIQTMLAGAPELIDPAVIRTQLAIAFVKRARKYCDEALLSGALGSADAVKGVEEGEIYTRIMLPEMTERLGPEGFDPTAYLDTWADYRAAVLADDPTAATTASDELITWNCAMQAALAIAACTDSADE
jgi:hypothetical protein